MKTELFPDPAKATSGRPEPGILPAPSLAREIFEDDTLDALYAIEDTELEDFARGGK